MSRRRAEEEPSATIVLARWARAVGPMAALALLLAALAALHHELARYHYRDIVRVLRELPAPRVAAAFALTAVAYLIMTGYDALALRYAGQRLPARKVALASGVAYGLGQTLGFPLLVGGSVRYRFWSAYGLTTVDIARAISFVGATFTLGVVAITGGALLLEPGTTLAALRVSPMAAHIGGLLCIALLATYVASSVVRKGAAVRLRGWSLTVPSPAMATAQIIVATADWAAAGAVLYVLLPPEFAPPFVAFLGIFALAQVAGIVSHIPGGLGVFETIMLVLLRGRMSADVIAGTLLAYRAIYYLTPFLTALFALALYEVRSRAHRMRAAAAETGIQIARWTSTMLPLALALMTFVGGSVLLLSGVTPALRPRMALLTDVLSLGVVEFSHFVASVAGAALLVLAWGLYRRLDAAYMLTVGTLALGIVVSLLKGLDWEEASLLAMVLGVVVPSRRAFYRKGALLRDPIGPAWMAATTAVIAAMVWLGLIVYRHVGYSSELWWRVAEHADAPRFLRASAGAVVLLLVVGVYRLVRPARAIPAHPSPADLDRARPIVRRSPRVMANLALLGDKALLFDETGDAFLMYAVEGRSWVALGDPVGMPGARAELPWRFREEADRFGAWCVFYEVGPEMLPVYVDLGLTLLKLGEEARVPLEGFTLDGAERRGLRRATRDAEKAGATFEIISPERAAQEMGDLRDVSDAWLAARNTREKRFSLGRFDERYLREFPVAVVRAGDAAGTRGRAVAFANVLTSDTHEELSVDLMRYTADAPRGVMDYLFTQLMLWGAVEGYRWFNFGMAPLSGFDTRSVAPLWTRVGGWLYRHAEHFYHFQGLRRYKEKFRPVWTPRYLASPGGLPLPRVLANIATLIAGGARGVIAK